MVGDHEFDSACGGKLHLGRCADAGITRQDEFCALLDDRSQIFQVDAVAFPGAHGDVIGHVRARGLQGLNEDRRGGLAIDVEIAPYADRLRSADGGSDPLDCRPHPGQLGRRHRRSEPWIQEGAGGFGGGDAAPDESLRDQVTSQRVKSQRVTIRRVEVELREGFRGNGGRAEPTRHMVREARMR